MSPSGFRARFHRPALMLLAAFLAAVSAVLALAGYAAFAPAALPDPLAEYRPALNPNFPISDTLIDTLGQYSITVKVDPAARAYTGTLELTLPYTGTAPLEEFYFRLYPNLYHFGARMQVTSARIDDDFVNYDYSPDPTSIHLTIPHPIQPGETTRIALEFNGKETRANTPGAYTIFGTNEGVLTLTNFYPILAARRADGSWALDVANPQGDVGFHDAAFYRVEVTAPADEVIAATGVEITRTQQTKGWDTTRFVIGPAREFSMVMSPEFQVEEVEALGARIRSYFKPEDAANARTALYAGLAAMEVYSDRFGPYPYREMNIVQSPLTYHGMEFPGMSLIGGQTYNKFLQDLEMLTVHEVAHQWWYNQVGNDQVLTPWLDEGLAEFSTQYYYRDRWGAPTAEQLLRTRWAAPVADAERRGKDEPIGKAVTDYENNYETMVYGKGALFFATLRDQLGPDTFDPLLRTYLERYRWKIATPADFQALAEEVSGKDLDELFNEWVYGQ